MEKIAAIVRRKPLFFLGLSLGYLILVGLLKWRAKPPVSAIWFLLGGALGVYFLDIAEEFFQLSPSPFRSIIFQILFMVVSVFVVTSSGSLLASGLVLSIYLTLVLWQIGEWRSLGNLSSWYRLIAGGVSARAQLLLFVAFIALFSLETFVFIR